MSETSVNHAPTRVSASAAVGAAGVAGTLGLGGPGWWTLLAPSGVVVVTLGLWRGIRWLVAAGCTCPFCATFVTGVTGDARLRLVAAAATFVAWDLGDRAIALGEQLRRQATTWRLECVHAAATVAVATVSVGVVYPVFSLLGGRRPLASLVLLLAGIAALLTALRSE